MFWVDYATGHRTVLQRPDAADFYSADNDHQLWDSSCLLGADVVEYPTENFWQ